MKLLSREDWGVGLDLDRGWVRSAQSGDFPKPLNPVGIVVHHMEPNAKFNRASELAQIARLHHWFNFHVDERLWSDIGYHFLISPQGTIFEGRKGSFSGQLVQGSHALNNNSLAIGIGMLGNFTQESPSDQALESLFALIQTLQMQYAIGSVDLIDWTYTDDQGKQSKSIMEAIIGHRDLKNTECPGEALYQFLPEMRRLLI